VSGTRTLARAQAAAPVVTHGISETEQRLILTALRQTAARVVDIARDHGRSVITIQRIANEHGVALRGRM
jgi:hypothetical protein